MKLLVKVFTILVLGFVTVLCLIKLVNVNLIINELDNISSLAMKNTQEKMKDMIINKEFHITSDNYFRNNKEYEDYYKNYFLDNVKRRDIYKINVTGDIEYGIIYVEIENNYSDLIATKKLLNIIEVEDN